MSMIASKFASNHQRFQSDVGDREIVILALLCSRFRDLLECKCFTFAGISDCLWIVIMHIIIVRYNSSSDDDNSNTILCNTHTSNRNIAMLMSLLLSNYMFVLLLFSIYSCYIYQLALNSLRARPRSCICVCVCAIKCECMPLYARVCV